MTLCPSRTRSLGTGAAGDGPAAHSAFAGPCGREGPWPCEARARPGSAGGRYVGWGSVDQRRLPDKAGELARAGDGGDVGGLAALGGELVPLAVEAPLGAPGDRAGARVLALLAGAQLRGDPRPAPGVFGRLDQQPARVLGTGLGDLALAALLVGAALGGHEAEEGAELAGVAKTLEVADRVDRRLVVGEGDLRGQVGELERAQPRPVGVGPVVAGTREPQPAAAQEVREPLAGAVEIAAQVLAGADQVAQLLLGNGRDPHEGELARGQQARQTLGVAGVGLDPVGRLARDQPGRADAHIEAALGGSAGQPEAGRAGLVDSDHARPELLDAPQRHERITLEASAPQLSRLAIEDSGVGLVGVDVEAHETRNLRHAVGTSHSWGVGRRPILRPSPRTSMSWGAGPSTSTGGHRPLHRV